MIRLFLFFMVSMMMTGVSMAEEPSPCPADTIPITIMNAVKPQVGPLSTVNKVGFTEFRDFVKAVTEHVAAKLAQENLCLGSIESQERSLLQFVSWDVSPYALGEHYRASRLEVQPVSGCRISSPWIDLVIEREPVPWVRGIVRWNERQLLADQAVLEGASNVPPGLARPLERSEFEQYADLEYAVSEIHHQPSLKPIEERVPPDLLWLFRRAWQDPKGFFSSSAEAAMRKAMKTGAEAYTKVVIALIDNCFASGGADIHYSSILDVADLVPLEPYKIDTPISVKRIAN